VLTTSSVKVVHYLFSNLAVGREKLAGIIGAKNSIGLRGYDISFFEINHPGSYSSLFWESVDSIQANSNDLYIWALKWGANKKIPIKIINAAVNDDFILDSSLVKKRQNFDRINLIFVGRLHWKKGLDTLFRIFLNLLKTKNVFLDIVGDGPEMEKIKFLIEKLNLYDRVFIRGKLSQNDILKCFDDSDILLAPSIQEGCSNVVLEAQARGLYCIVSNAEGMNEVVEVNKTGVICDMWDDKKWVEEVIAYSNFDYKDRLKISEYSISRISKYFTRSSQVKQWNSYFNGLCSNL
jgi:colanic acid/amylovoran biosynthesis glycosyltransferase